MSMDLFYNQKNNKAIFEENIFVQIKIACPSEQLKSSGTQQPCEAADLREDSGMSLHV